MTCQPAFGHVLLTVALARLSGDGLCRGSCTLRCRGTMAVFAVLGGVRCTTTGVAEAAPLLGVTAAGDSCAAAAAGALLMCRCGVAAWCTKTA